MFGIGVLILIFVVPILLPIWLICGWYAGVVQKRNNYHEKQKKMEEATGSKALSKPATTLINCMMGPFALIFMSVLPDTKNCLHCKEFILEKAIVCSHCGRSQEAK
ncbi:hypothetical protein UA32_12420 [Photobacterium angustum]|uniref:Zinc ribbon domain-containing protein n=1 Tax=Photobacterium angustum TaxID=661 RepID=A0ABX5H217_PHOAN|nr:hypothetical protein [Photobacterium angustum]KJG37751.1 hypothetical protein UA32_12420 [Photobacterium angustum]PSX07018.1 hypothetical protein C0W27_15735 [Photobacterium angustum]